MRYEQGIVICLLLLGGCGGGSTSTPQPGAPAVTLSANPSSYTFSLNETAPVPVTISRSVATFASLGLAVGDPTQIGVTIPVLGGATATFSVIPVANGSTTVTATDGSGVSTTVGVASALCGRPSSIAAFQLLIPTSGASGVSTSIGTMYFYVYFASPTPQSGSLHLIVGQHGTLEGGTYAPATLPPGTVLPTPPPIPYMSSEIVAAAVPRLVAGQQYKTELYNDPCQPADVAGTFST